MSNEKNYTVIIAWQDYDDVQMFMESYNAVTPEEAFDKARAEAFITYEAGCIHDVIVIRGDHSDLAQPAWYAAEPVTE